MENGSGPSSQDPHQRAVELLHQYGLVAYIEGRLGEFLFRLREEVVPGCRLRSHVSVLPPRRLCGSEVEARNVLDVFARQYPAFGVSLGAVEVFPRSNVIFLGVQEGREELIRMHDEMNIGPLRFTEFYGYHPHITLAQEITTEAQQEALSLCEARWAEYNGPRSFPVDTLTFVQNIGACGWADLSEVHLEMAGSRR